MLVKEIMKKPFVVDKDISLKEAAKLMKEKKIGSLLFVEGSKVKGVVTEGDLTRNFGKKERVSQVMSSGVIAVNFDDVVDKAIEIMKKKKIKTLPVLDSGNLVGVITSVDIVENFDDLEEDFIFE